METDSAPEVHESPESSGGSEAPPLARRKVVRRRVHGVELVDEYAWLAERGSPEAISYLEAENSYAAGELQALEPLRRTLYQEFVGRIEETDVSAPVTLDGYFYYSRTRVGLQYRIFCRQAAAEGSAEEVLLDLNELAAGADYLGVGAVEVSPDHQLLAFCIDLTGGEAYELRVKELETGTLLDDRLEGVGETIAWANDSRTIFYTTLDAARRPYRVFRHALGQPPPDPEVYREDDEAFFVSVERTRSRGFILLSSGSAVTREVRYIPADRPEAQPRLVEPRCHGVEYWVDHRHDSFFLRTNREAKNFRLVCRPVGGTAADEHEVVAHRPETKLDRVDLFEERMVLRERADGVQRLRSVAFDGSRDVYVSLPESVYTLRDEPNLDFWASSYRFAYTSLVTPATVFAFDAATEELETLKVQQVKGGYDRDRYDTTRIVARAEDGAGVPVSLVHRGDLVLDGSNPCLLHGYGSYGMVVDPVFSSMNLSLLDRGFVVAVAHVRGGGLLGEEWHEDGRMLAKRNTFTDFIAAAEHLVAAGYTSPARLGIRGGSAGGLLVGAVLNMRPDLFRAAIALVPFVDVVNTMLDPSIPLTVIEFEEWGNPADREYFDYMLTYSPYDNLAEQEYPAMLVTAGLNDPRVQYWEPAKWVARLRALKTDANALLLRTHMGAGHAGPSGRYKVLEERALEYAFLVDALGVADGGSA